MSDLQNTAGRTVSEPVVLVTDEVLHLKLIPSRDEKLPFAITVAGAGIVSVAKLNNRTGPNYTSFDLHAATSADADHHHPGQGVARTVAIQVDPKIALPAADTDPGLLVRLFLVETDAPAATIALEDQQKSMRWMRLVVENRLATPSVDWDSKGATSLVDVIRAPGEFRGFEDYPGLPAEKQQNINDILRIANTAGDGRRVAMAAYVASAIAIASGDPPRDPTAKGLYWWRTKDSGSPGRNMVKVDSVLKNTFYTRK